MIDLIPGKFYKIQDHGPLAYFTKAMCSCHKVFLGPRIYNNSWWIYRTNCLKELGWPNYFQYQFGLKEVYEQHISEMVPGLEL